MNQRVSLAYIVIFTSTTSQLWHNITYYADAKLMLWPEQDEEEYLSSQMHEKKRRPSKTKTHDFDSSTTIRDRLHLFHDDSILSESKRHSLSALSPARYLSLMLQYLQNQISGLSTYLYSSDDTSSQWSAYSLLRHNKYQAMVAEPKDAWEGLLGAFTALKTGYVGGVKFFVDGMYEFGCSSISACAALLPGGGSGENYAPFSSFLLEFGAGLTKGAEHTKNGLLLFAAGAVVGARNLMVGIVRTPEAYRSSRLGMLYYPMGKKELEKSNRYVERDSHKKVAMWDYYSLDYEDKEIKMEETKLKIDSDASKGNNRKSELLRKRRRQVRVKDSKFYGKILLLSDMM